MTTRDEVARRQSLQPQNIGNSVWYYEEGRTLHFYVQVNKFNRSTTVPGVIDFRVPISKLEKSLKRSPKKRSKS